MDNSNPTSSSVYSTTPENSDCSPIEKGNQLNGYGVVPSSSRESFFSASTDTIGDAPSSGNNNNSNMGFNRASAISSISRNSLMSAANNSARSSKRHSASSRSLIRQERAKFDPTHPQFYYNQRALQESDHVSIEPSSTGNDPLIGFGSLFVDPRDITSPKASSTQNNSRSYFVENFTNSGSGDSANKALPSRVNGGHVDENAARYTNKSPNQTTITSTTLESNLQNRSFPPAWIVFCRLVTLPLLPSTLKWMGIEGMRQQAAWREKIGLNVVIAMVTAFIGFFTFGLSKLVCGNPAIRIHQSAVPSDSIVVHGRIFNISNFHHTSLISPIEGFHGLAVSRSLGATDGSLLFQNVNHQCKGLILPDARFTGVAKDRRGRVSRYFPCQALTLDGRLIEHPIQRFKANDSKNESIDFSISDPKYGCHLSAGARTNFYTKMRPYGEVYFTWDDIGKSSRNLAVYHGEVLDLDRLKFLTMMNWRLAPELRKFLGPRDKYHLQQRQLNLIQRDLSSQMIATKRDRKAARCLIEIAKVGVIGTDTIGCLASALVLIISVTFIISIVVTKFLFAVYFEWFLSWRMGKGSETWNKVSGTLMSPYFNGDKNAQIDVKKKQRLNTPQVFLPSFFNSSSSGLIMPTPPETTVPPNEMQALAITTSTTASPDTSSPDPDLKALMIEHVPKKYVICLVTAYSESIEGLRKTLDALAMTDYPLSHKLILVVCDGIVTGSGNKVTTPEIVLSMMNDFLLPPDHVKERAYVAVASGEKRVNMAKVYSGFYLLDRDSENFHGEERKTPMIAIIKCGTSKEKNTNPKPGNRGKRDSQIILMSFLQKVIFEERMTDLENELYLSFYKLMDEHKPDIFEAVLMVDADTEVYSDSITHMVHALDRDPSIMGLCGETKIENKRDSWVTMIQVFEYFISHHYTKSFESVFGGVTCLPGCFCMYRIKAPKGPDGYWVPILANPDIVERYSINTVESLHRKNLLLLGEDRYLTTLMLKTFSQRKQVFVPQAKCKTVVPTEFKVLLDQRRRWINSTIHNLLELLFVRDLCGVFCISMQFVVIIELLGTVTLPAALCFTIYLFISALVTMTLPLIPIVLLTLILGIPAVLIVVTGHKWVYLGWMIIYLLSLPVWNFILPLNAFWKFDDFSWGNTREVTPLQDMHIKGKESRGIFDSSQIRMLRFHEYMFVRNQPKSMDKGLQ